MDTEKRFEFLARAGYAARGALFLIVGIFFVFAGVTIDSAQAGGLADALVWVRGLPFGALLYGLSGMGLSTFGC